MSDTDVSNTMGKALEGMAISTTTGEALGNGTTPGTRKTPELGNSVGKKTAVSDTNDRPEVVSDVLIKAAHLATVNVANASAMVDMAMKRYKEAVDEAKVAVRLANEAVVMEQAHDAASSAVFKMSV